MKRQTIFAFRVNNQEKQLIAELAKDLHRSQSDAIRFVLLYASRQWTQADLTPCISFSNKDQERSKDGQDADR